MLLSTDPLGEMKPAYSAVVHTSDKPELQGLQSADSRSEYPAQLLYALWVRGVDDLDCLQMRSMVFCWNQVAFVRVSHSAFQLEVFQCWYSEENQLQVGKDDVH